MLESVAAWMFDPNAVFRCGIDQDQGGDRLLTTKITRKIADGESNDRSGVGRAAHCHRLSQI